MDEGFDMAEVAGEVMSGAASLGGCWPGRSSRKKAGKPIAVEKVTVGDVADGIPMGKLRINPGASSWGRVRHEIMPLARSITLRSPLLRRWVHTGVKVDDKDASPLFALQMITNTEDPASNVSFVRSSEFVQQHVRAARSSNRASCHHACHGPVLPGRP